MWADCEAKDSRLEKPLLRLWDLETSSEPCTLSSQGGSSKSPDIALASQRGNTTYNNTMQERKNWCTVHTLTTLGGLRLLPGCISRLFRWWRWRIWYLWRIWYISYIVSTFSIQYMIDHCAQSFCSPDLVPHERSPSPFYRGCTFCNFSIPVGYESMQSMREHTTGFGKLVVQQYT